nr:organic cation/carnitine transporter 7 [Quercus suber]
MEDQSLVYTVDEALAAMGFGKFQALVLVYAGLGWFAEATKMMLISFMEDQSLVYTVDEALAAMGFGKFQALVLVYAGLGGLLKQQR